MTKAGAMRLFTKGLAIFGLRESGKHVFLRSGGGPGCPKCSVFACRRNPGIPKARVFACFWGLRCSGCRVFSCLFGPRSGPQSRGSRGRPGGRLEARKRPFLGLYGKTRGPRGPGAPNHGKNACDRGTLRASVGALVFPQGLQGAPSAPPDRRCTGLGPISCEPGRNRAVGRPSVRRGRIGPHGLLGGPEPPSVRPGRVFGDFACVFPLRLACAGVPKPASRAVEGAWAAPGSLLAVPGPVLAVPGRS